MKFNRWLSRFFLLIGVGFFSIGFCGAQEITQNVRGKVVDEATQIPLFGVNVCLFKDSVVVKCAATDEKGNFILKEIPIGKYTILTSYLGYKPYAQTNIDISSSKEKIITINLIESAIKLATVEIESSNKLKAINELSTVSTRTFTIEETERYAGSRNDPARMASNYAGTRGADDSRNDIIIRGNTPLGLLWQLEDLPIPNPNHFALFGTTGGPVSMLNNKMLANSDFMTGAFPAEYGNAIAGVFDLKMRNGNNQKFEHTLQLGIIGLEGVTEGPINKTKGSSYLATYRFSTLELMQAAGISFGVSATPKFQDASFKLNFPGNKISFSVYGMGGKSDIAFKDSERDTSDWSFGDAGRDVFFGSKMGLSGVNAFKSIGKKTALKIGANTSYNSSYSTHNLMRDTVDFNTVLNQPLRFKRNVSEEIDVNAKLALTHKINASNTIKAGMLYTSIFLNITDSAYQHELHQMVEQSGINENTYLLQSFIHWKWNIKDAVTINSGVHYQYFGLNGSYAVEPRLGIKIPFSNIQSVSLAYGMHHQIQPIYVYYKKTYNEHGIYGRFNTSMDFTQSQHLVLAYDRLLNEHHRIKIETYYQLLNKIPVHAEKSSSFSLINQGTDYTFIDPKGVLVNKGTGTNYGLEITLERTYYKGWFYLLTGSLYESKYKGSDGIERNTNFNGNYSLNVLSGKGFRVGKNKTNVLGLGTKFTLAGGNRYTPFDPTKSNFFEVAYYDSLAYSGKFKDYKRLDIKITYTKNRFKTKHEYGLDLVNVLNIKNVLTRTFNPFTRQAVNEEQLGFLPIFYYKLEF